MNIITVQRPALAAYISMIAEAKMIPSGTPGHIDLYVDKDIRFWHNEFVKSSFYNYNNKLIEAQEIKRKTLEKKTDHTSGK